ncbi:hypothetical protein VTO42DRAFT_1031 [Malbranchea cinnamomea]
MATTTPPASSNEIHPGNPNAESGYLNRGYGFHSGSRPNSFVATNSIVHTDFHVRNGTPAVDGNSSRFHEEFSVSRRATSLDGIPRAESQLSTSHPAPPSRTGTLKKKSSLGKKGSLRRGGSRRSSRAGSVRSINLGEKEKYGVTNDELNSAFYVPIPTSGSPTELLANRFQAWRKVLKDLINIFRDIQRSYESRAKMLLSASNAMNSITIPSTFLISGGIADATDILKDYHRRAYLEANKAKEVEAEIIMQLTGLRSDLQQKIKEIKALAGDFKNTVDKEVESTRKAVRHLHEALGLVDTDAAATSGKGDPFIIKMEVDRQIQKQLEEENYLHRAYLNLESSGRELESIVVGEIQKAYNAYASILKRDADTAYDTVDRLRNGPISMPKDHEWNAFIAQTDHLVDPSIPLRNVENITYPGKDHPAAAEVRSGMLERKSKYLKSYTPGWYVLSPTHLHEFKSADRISSQALVMSLYLPEQKLGSHSQPESSSHKFILKGRQTGSMHRGHAWVFRAESHDTMLAWYEDIKNLTEKTGEARNAFVKKHVRSLSGASFRASIDSERALEEDEADETPYMADSRMISANTQRNMATGDSTWQRPQPGGRFPSEVHLDRTTHVPNSPSSSRSPEDQMTLSTRVSAPALGPPYEEPRPVQEANTSDGPAARTAATGVWTSDGDEQQNTNYAEWTTPSTPTPHERRTSNDIGLRNLTSPPRNDNQFHIQTVVAPSRGDLATVPGSHLHHSADTGSQPIAHQTDANRGTGSAAQVGAKGSESLASEEQDTQQTDRSAPDDQSTLHKPSMSSRASTVSDLQLPGQYPRGKK